MLKKIINTPNLLATEYGLSSPLNSVNEPTSKVKYKQVTSEGIKIEKLSEEQYKKQNTSPNNTNTGVLLGGLATPKDVQTITDDEYDGDFTYETRPTQYQFSKKNYNSKSRVDKERSLSSIKYIVLHHTALPSYKDKCKQIFNTVFKGSYKSSHAVMDGNGHIEYMIPIKYIANTQGIIYSDKNPRTNPLGVSIEIQNLGWLKQQRKKNGIQYYGRGSYSLPEDQVSKVYDYNLNVIKGGKYKGMKYFEEYTNAQTEALAKWIKEMMNATGITWKFTEETYKQMFPNKQKTKLPLKAKIEDGVAFVAYKKSSKGIILGRGKYGGWGVSKDIYNGIKGVYTHCSITQDKIDIGPTYNIIKMLKTHFS